MTDDALEAIKQQCPFCKIVKGEIPSKKVYEDEHLIAILDINPAAKGHLLLMPKEHYPIMPLVPQNISHYLFKTAKYISKAVKEGILATGTNLFIANGAAAGQQAQHFMLHIIPRDNDEIKVFRLSKNEFPEKDIVELEKNLSANLKVALTNLYARYPIEGKQSQISEEDLAKIVETNPQLKKLIVEDLEKLKQIIPKNPQLSALFAGINLDEFAKKFRKEKIVEAEFEEVEEPKKKKERKNLDKISGLFKNE